MGIEEKVGWNVGLMLSVLSEIISCYLSICYQIGWNGWNRNYSKTYLSCKLVLHKWPFLHCEMGVIVLRKGRFSMAVWALLQMRRAGCVTVRYRTAGHKKGIPCGMPYMMMV